MALEQQLGARLSGGLAAVKDRSGCRTKNIQLLETSHPLPTNRSVQAGRRMVTLAQSLTRRDLLLVLISGGASSLLAGPALGLTLRDKKHTTSLLLRCGATIQEMNTVRKHLSLIKGGQLAASTSATIVSLVLSDVVGDDLATIGSGLTAPDPTTFQDARDVLVRYGMWTKVLPAVRGHIQKGLDGRIIDTPKPKSSVFTRGHHALIGNNRLMAEAIIQQARVAGLNSLLLTTTLEGEASEVGHMIGAIAREIQSSGHPVPRPACLVWGGEPTVLVRGTGHGGRAQELVLSAAIRIAGLSNMYVAGFGTDGHDGPTDMAGAIVNGRTIDHAVKNGMDPLSMLANNDSYEFFKKVHGHIYTGPTGTNVNDVYLLLAL